MATSNRTAADITSLISELAGDDGIARAKARLRLVEYKGRAVGPLVEALSDKHHWVRWEAAKALSQIGNEESVLALIEALSDKEFDVRWLAAEGLIRIGRKSIVPLLSALEEHPDSDWLREGIHHALHDLRRRGLGQVLLPVLAALEGNDPSLEAPLAARAALKRLEGR
jgi:HEAT repeat protein